MNGKGDELPARSPEDDKKGAEHVKTTVETTHLCGRRSLKKRPTQVAYHNFLTAFLAFDFKIVFRSGKGGITELLDGIFILATWESDKNAAAQELVVLLIPFSWRILCWKRRAPVFFLAGK